MSQYSRVLLFSGGVDSYLAWHWLGKPATVYFNTQNRYADRELAVVKDLIPQTVVDATLNFQSREIGDNAHIDFRNLHFALLAAHYSDDIVIVGIQDDVVEDKSELVFAKFSILMSEMMRRPIKVWSPFWEVSKEEIVRWYLSACDGGREEGIRNLLRTISCYSPLCGTNYCGACRSCFRKWVAFVNNGIPLAFGNDDLIVEYEHRAIRGQYTSKRNDSILRAVAYWRTHSVDKCRS